MPSFLSTRRNSIRDVYKRQEDVTALLKQCGYPGMKVLEFAFDSRDGGDYRPPVSYTHLDVYKRQLHTKTCNFMVVKEPTYKI